MNPTTNRPSVQEAPTKGFTLSVPNTLEVDELYLSDLSNWFQHGVSFNIYINSVQKGFTIENEIQLELEHPFEFGLLKLRYAGQKFHDYFPRNATIKVSKILLKQSNTNNNEFCIEDIQEDIRSGYWNIKRIDTKKKEDRDYLFRRAIIDKYKVILAVLLEIIDTDNSSQKLRLYLRGTNETILSRAAKEQDNEIIKDFLDYHPIISHNAVIERDTKNINIPFVSFDCKPILLHRAVMGEDIEVIKVLLDYKVDINETNQNGSTPLHIAVDLEMSDIIDFLISNGADVNATNDNHHTPLHFAIKRNNLKILDNLLKNQAEIDKREMFGDTPLFYAVEQKNPNIVDFLLKKGANYKLTKYKFTAFDLAVVQRSLDIIKVFIENNVDLNIINSFGQLCLDLGIGKNCLTTVQFLLKNGIDVNLTDSSGQTALHTASCVHNISMKILNSILNAINNINAKDNLGRTAIHYAALHNNIDTLKCLLEKNADINAVDKNLMSPLHLACLSKNVIIVKYLIENGADSSMRDKDGRTVFHHVCMIKSCLWNVNNMIIQIENILNLLVEADISVNCVDQFGKTPLHYVIEDEDDKYDYALVIIKVLLNMGADINAEDLNHYSVIDKFKEFYFLTPNKRASLYLQHIVKMKVMKLRVLERTLDKVYKVDDEYHLKWIQRCERECNKEIDSMKTTYIDQSNITYYGFLKSANYVRNQNVVKAIKSDELMVKFPNYGHLLKCHLRKIQPRSKLYNQIHELSKSCILKKLPILCINEVMKYLDGSELKIFLEAIKLTVEKVE